ncbi:transporter substrate-binding domain-containing protein [Streptosporangium sp. NPDC006930]|uniref:transporter substrate-binding domain-containing protein n=1 Tax=unclassified Streptosporangium TaxID=2632669 RepID=UPI003418387B
MALVRIRRALGVVAVGVLGTTVLSACGGSSTESVSASAPASGTSESQVYVIPQQVGVPPYSFLDDGGKLAGLLPDLSTALGEEMGVTVKNEQASFENSLLGLQRGAYAWVPGADVTAERLKKFDFATTLIESYGFRVKADGITIGDSLDDLCGVSVAVTAGSSPVSTLKDQSKKCEAAGKKPVDVQTFADQATADLAVKSGRTDASTATSSGLGYQTRTEPGVWKITGPIYQAIDIGFASMKGDGMAAKLQQATEALIKNGTYAKILAKYGTENMSIKSSVINPEPHA